MNFTLGIAGGTKDGQGQPASSTSLNTTLPVRPEDQQQELAEEEPVRPEATMRAQKSPNSCPKSSKVGAGVSIAKAGSLTET